MSAEPWLPATLVTRKETVLLRRAVRVDEDVRGDGLGTAMFDWAIRVAHLEGCALVQLTSDTSRVDAHRFYERLGFLASHHGFKREL